jgi:DNA-binding Xre family transcriptional regulator
MVTWKLREYLDQHEVSAYALTKAADLAPNTVYALARGDQGRVDLVVLDKVIEALEQLTGQRVSVSDLLEREEPEYEFSNGVPDDIRERIRRFEAGETTLRPWSEVDAEQRAKRGL